MNTQTEPAEALAGAKKSWRELRRALNETELVWRDAKQSKSRKRAMINAVNHYLAEVANDAPPERRAAQAHHAAWYCRDTLGLLNFANDANGGIEVDGTICGHLRRLAHRFAQLADALN